MRIVINELTDNDVENKIQGEISQANAPILTNNKQDRIAIKHVRAKSFTGKINQLIVMWEKNRQKKSRVVEG